jgi:hypothetical protein
MSLPGLIIWGHLLANSYTEFYFGIKFLNFRAMYGWSHLNGRKADSGFRIATGL